MAPAHDQVVHAAAGPVDSVLGAVHVVTRVWIGLEHFGVDATLVEATADRKRVANDVPLALAAVVKEEHQLA